MWWYVIRRYWINKSKRYCDLLLIYWEAFDWTSAYGVFAVSSHFLNLMTLNLDGSDH